MRWKAIMYNPDIKDDRNTEEYYGLKTLYCPKQVKEITAFEKDLYDVVKNLKFRKTKNNFQRTLNEDIKSIYSSNKTMTFADKTTNMYRLTKEEHEKLLTNAITSKYKKTNDKIKENINKKGKELFKGKNILNRLEINEESNCFISLKDHKENFMNNPTVRLINPAKNQIGRISKVILDKINLGLKEHLKINQWKNTKNVIDWFTKIEDKPRHKFIMFDIKDFYPSITEPLLMKALNFAEKHTRIPKEDIAIIKQARQSLLFNNNETWMKKESGLFDVTQGALDGAEICELIGIFSLYELSQTYNKNNIGLYRDDGLGVFKNISGPEFEKIKKHFQKVFKKHKLDIVIQCNMKIVNYLDVTFDLENSTYRPYLKENNQIKYIHKESNHPPAIIKQLPISIESRLSSLSSTEQIFNESVKPYQDALEASGYTHKLKYNKNIPQNNSRNQRKRKIIWFNPPFSKNVKTNIGKTFLNLLKKHFPPQNKFYKLFNKNTVKISYSCMQNMKQIINSHNKKILSPKVNTNQRTCNCINKNTCPLEQKCLTKNIVYKATVTSNCPTYKSKIYFGLCETTFKQRYSNHKRSFNIARYKNDTELSNEIWRLKSLGIEAKIKWEIVRQCVPYNPQTKRCLLCLNEKLEIASYQGDNLLNKRSEIISKCRHQLKYALARYDTKD